MRQEFTIKCSMEERWAPYFLSMLDQMEYLGNIGSSRIVAICSDGDGDFRPKFEFADDFSFEIKEPEEIRTGYLYDAG